MRFLTQIGFILSFGEFFLWASHIRKLDWINFNLFSRTTEIATSRFFCSCYCSCSFFIYIVYLMFKLRSCRIPLFIMSTHWMSYSMHTEPMNLRNRIFKKKTTTRTDERQMWCGRQRATTTTWHVYVCFKASCTSTICIYSLWYARAHMHIVQFCRFSGWFYY